jgi:hypothetical protein
LVTRPIGATYTVSLIGLDGRVAASAQASSPAPVGCPSAAADVPLPVSTSNSRAYYMDVQGVVRFLSPQGATGRATSVPAPTARTRSMFAVSPDDQRIAVVVATFNSGGASTSLYVEDLNGGNNHLVIFNETGAYTLWPIGWHGINNLVVAKVAACSQGGGPFCCGPLELHVIDPATGVRRLTLGGSGCVVAGAPSTAGVACEVTAGYTSLEAINWTGGVFSTINYVQGAVPAYLNPDGNRWAVASNGTTVVLVGGSGNLEACEWMDGYHLLAGGDAQQQPRIWDLTKTNLIPVAAQGDCAGRIPGSL